MADLRGQHVWITGASSGIGAALAHAFSARGARLVLSARRRDRLAEVAAAAGAKDALLWPLDLADTGSLADHTRGVLEAIGHVDVMVHNAGVGQRGRAADTALSVDRQLMDVNYFGPLALTKALLPGMRARKSGRFVVMSSVLGLFSAPERTGYAAAKHALHGFFDGLRAELSDEGIGVLLVCPGHVNSEFSQAALEADGSAHAVTDAASASGLTPEACARAVLRAYDDARDQVTVARWEHLAVALQRVSPSLFRRVIARRAQR